MNIIACGSDDWGNYEKVKQRLERLPADTVVIHTSGGGAAEVVRSVSVLIGRKEVTMDDTDAMFYECPELLISFGPCDLIAVAQSKSVPVELVT